MPYFTPELDFTFGRHSKGDLRNYEDYDGGRFKSRTEYRILQTTTNARGWIRVCMYKHAPYHILQWLTTAIYFISKI
jgi:hypothetical protein